MHPAGSCALSQLFLALLVVAASQFTHPRHGNINIEFWIIQNEGRILVEEVRNPPMHASLLILRF